MPVFFTIFLRTCEICKLQFALLVKNRARERVEQTRQIVKFLCLWFPGKFFLRTKIKLNLISLPLPSAWACDLCPVESAKNHVSCIKDVIWLADACLKEVEGKNEQDGRVLKAVSSGVVFSTGFTEGYFVSTPVKLLKESIMSVATIVGPFDDIVRSASVLAEGIEGGLCWRFVVRCISSFLVVSDSLQFFFLSRIYQIRITTRRMPEEMACCRKWSCSIETRHR